MIEKASLFFGVPLPSRYAAGLAHRARRVFAHSKLYRPRLAADGDTGRDQLYVFMRHWLAARLHVERAELFVRLPKDYATGEALPVGAGIPFSPRFAEECFLSNEARLLSAF